MEHYNGNSVGSKRPLSLLRKFVEPVPEVDTLGVEGHWNWNPSVPFDPDQLKGYCPATGSEGGED